MAAEGQKVTAMRPIAAIVSASLLAGAAWASDAGGTASVLQAAFSSPGAGGLNFTAIPPDSLCSATQEAFVSLLQPALNRTAFGGEGKGQHFFVINTTASEPLLTLNVCDKSGATGIQFAVWEFLPGNGSGWTGQEGVLVGTASCADSVRPPSLRLHAGSLLVLEVAADASSTLPVVLTTQCGPCALPKEERSCRGWPTGHAGGAAEPEEEEEEEWGPYGATYWMGDWMLGEAFYAAFLPKPADVAHTVLQGPDICGLSSTFDTAATDAQDRSFDGLGPAHTLVVASPRHVPDFRLDVCGPNTSLADVVITVTILRHTFSADEFPDAGVEWLDPIPVPCNGPVFLPIEPGSTYVIGVGGSVAGDVGSVEVTTGCSGRGLCPSFARTDSYRECIFLYPPFTRNYSVPSSDAAAVRRCLIQERCPYGAPPSLLQCQPGTFSRDHWHCLPCPQGSYCPSGEMISSPQPCPPGFSSAIGAAAPEDCAPCERTNCAGPHLDEEAPGVVVTPYEKQLIQQVPYVVPLPSGRVIAFGGFDGVGWAGGVYGSDDGGVSWRPVLRQGAPASGPQARYYGCAFVHPVHSTVTLVGGYAPWDAPALVWDVEQSHDGGSSWTSYPFPYNAATKYSAFSEPICIPMPDGRALLVDRDPTFSNVVVSTSSALDDWVWSTPNYDLHATFFFGVAAVLLPSLDTCVLAGDTTTGHVSPVLIPAGGAIWQAIDGAPDALLRKYAATARTEECGWIFGGRAVDGSAYQNDLWCASQPDPTQPSTVLFHQRVAAAPLNPRIDATGATLISGDLLLMGGLRKDLDGGLFVTSEYWRYRPAEDQWDPLADKIQPLFGRAHVRLRWAAQRTCLGATSGAR